MKSFMRYVSISSLALSVSFISCKSSTPTNTEPTAAIAPTTTAVPVATVAPAAPAPVATPAAELVLQTIYFEFDSYALTATAQDTLRKMAEALKANASVKIQIEGHCDERGSNEYNLALGERRARAAKDFLNAEGVSIEAVSTISYGEEKPAAQGSDEATWVKNRRDEFKKL